MAGVEWPFLPLESKEEWTTGGSAHWGGCHAGAVGVGRVPTTPERVGEKYAGGGEESDGGG